MEISGKGFLHFYQQASSLIGNQTNHRTNMFLPCYSNSCYESHYECICIVDNGKIRSVPLNIFSSAFLPRGASDVSVIYDFGNFW